MLYLGSGKKILFSYQAAAPACRVMMFHCDGNGSHHFTLSTCRMAKITPIATESHKIGFSGAGKMAESIAIGGVKSGVLPAFQILTGHLATARRITFESFGSKSLITIAG